MKLKRIVSLGRYFSLDAQKYYNIKRGVSVDDDSYVYFYVIRNQRQVIDSDIFLTRWVSEKKVIK